VPRFGSGAGRDTRPEVLDLTVSDLSPLVRRAEILATASAGWITLQPQAEDAGGRAGGQQDAPGPAAAGVSALVAAFAVADPRFELPLCTWVPGRRARRGVRPDSLGIQHAMGRRALEILDRHALGLPEGWQRAQDHPRRGLVVVPSPACSVEAELLWLMQAGAALSVPPLSGCWRAWVHGPP